MDKRTDQKVNNLFSGGSSGPETLLDNEIASIKQQAFETSIRDYTMISLALATGIRNHELVSLMCYCIAPFDEIVTILDLPLSIAKGGKPRSIPLHPDVIIDLDGFLSWKKMHDESIEPQAPLFCSKYSKKQLTERDFQRITKNICFKAIGRDIHPHIFRHTFATNLLKKSNLAVVKKVLGHTNIQTTQIYLHPSSSDVATAIEKM